MTATRVSWRLAEITNSFDIFRCLPGAWRGTVRKVAPCVCVEVPQTDGNRSQMHELTLAGGGAAFSSYTIRPGTTPLAREDACAPLSPRGLYRLPTDLFSSAAPWA